MRRGVVAGLVAVTLLSTPATASAWAGDGFVTRSGSQLLLDGQPYRFTGLNIYNANSDGWCWYAMDDGSALDEALAAIGPGKKVFRSWFFQPLAIGGGARDWSAFDHTLDVAGSHGKKVIATLSDQWGECGDGGLNGFKTQSWYEAGYEQGDPGMLVSYRDWVAEVVTRYRDDPRIAFWQLMNEAEVKPSEGDPCPGDGSDQAQVLGDWTADVAGLVKSIDPNHLVSLGTIGSGQCGASGDQYEDLHAIPEIDLCEYHDYGSPAVPIPGDEWNGLQVRLEQCTALGKPLFVGEAGIVPDDLDGTLLARADAFAAKLQAQLAAGVAGFLAWAWSNLGSTTDTYDIGPGDPTLEALALFDQGDPPVVVEPKSAKSLGLKARKRAVPRGRKAKLRAVVGPCPATSGEQVELQRRKPAAWVTIGSAIAALACTALFKVKVKRAIVVRAFSPEDPDHLAATSERVKIKVRKGG